MRSSGERPLLKGAMTALVTPFDANDQVDVEALERLVEWQVASGIHGLVPCGTTGEGATLDEDEHRLVIETVARTARGRVPVVAGCGSNDTRRTVAAAIRAATAGADALLVVTPYYNKPNPSGMREHYRRVAEATALPVVAYNVPSRTGQNLTAEQMLELARIPGVCGIKEASADLDQIATVIDGRPEGFAVLSGDDALALPTMALGADGLISVVSNVAPAETSRLIDAAAAGRMPAARELHFRLLPLMRALFAESNPVPVKAVLAMLGRADARVRLPLGRCTSATRDRLARALQASGITEAEAVR